MTGEERGTREFIVVGGSRGMQPSPRLSPPSSCEIEVISALSIALPEFSKKKRVPENMRYGEDYDDDELSRFP